MIYAAADFILRPMVLAFLLLTAAALGLAWHGTFSRSGGGHTAPRRALDWPGLETVPAPAPDVREETLVSAGHNANWEPDYGTGTINVIRHPGIAEIHDLPIVTVTDDPAGKHAQPRIHAFMPGMEPYCGNCGQSGHWRGDESCADAVVTELVTRHRDGKVAAAIAASLEAEGFRYHATTDGFLDSIIGGIEAIRP
jgi:hypothetical protein